MLSKCLKFTRGVITKDFAQVRVLQVWVELRQPPALLFGPDDECVQGPPDPLRGGGLGFGAVAAGVRVHRHGTGGP